MTTETRPFRVSAGLKNLIGRELITDPLVAVFELVKNSFDAHATTVRLCFEDDRLIVTDNGKGMTRKSILDKWLFVGYSAKRDQSEDDDYRHRLGTRSRNFAGDKGIGRFSCDSLGKRLSLYSCAEGNRVQTMHLDWGRYEVDAKREIHEIPVTIGEMPGFDGVTQPPDDGVGTVLEIEELRHEWPRARLLDLRRGLAKLINPFRAASHDFRIELVAPAEDDADRRAKDGQRVNGPIENTLLEVLKDKTTVLRATLSADNYLETMIEDRGELIYHIREPNPYSSLRDLDIQADLFYLNRSAKTTFARRMGLPSARFGSIFVFRDGFRMFPIGEEYNDFFGLTRRKQQGTYRYLGSRDLIGRVDVPGASGFEEATSRSQGLIHTPAVNDLVTFVVRKCVRRLERYVVDITWKDTDDRNSDDPSRLRLDRNRGPITQLVAHLADTKAVEVIDYNRDLVGMLDRRSGALEENLKSLAVLAEKTGDAALVERVAAANLQLGELKASEAAAVEAAEAAAQRAVAAEDRRRQALGQVASERERNRFLVAAQSLDEDTILNLHHQIMVHATGVQLWIKRMAGKIRDGMEVESGEWGDFLAAIAFQSSQILTAARFATKADYKAGVGVTDDNLVGYIRDYIEEVASLWAPRGIELECHGEVGAVRRHFRPIDVGIVIDNLVSNAAKANADRVVFAFQTTNRSRASFVMTVADDGDGWPKSIEPLEGVFEKGVTTTKGSGLGLYHVKQVITAMHGEIVAHDQPYSEIVGGAHLTVRIEQ